MSTIQSILLNELSNRKKSNPLFSLRAFARQLKMSPAQLSLLINGKKKLTPRMADLIIDRLDLSKSVARQLINDTNPLQDKVKTKVDDYKILSSEEFQLISDWVHFAILEMTELKNNQGQAQWIAKELNIDLVRAKISLQRLVRMGFIQIKNGQLFRTTKPLSTTTDIPSSAIRSFHKQNLELAKEKIESIPVELREFTSITTSVSLKKLARIKKLLNEFKFQINQELEGEDASEVYSLSIQLFPLTKVESRVETKDDSRMGEFELRRNNLDKKSKVTL